MFLIFAASDGSGFVRVMYVFFLGVVPFVSLFLFFVYYWRQNRPSFLRKSANVYVQNVSVISGDGGAGGLVVCRVRRPAPKPPAPAPVKSVPIIGSSRLISCTNPRVICDSSEIVLNSNFK